VRVSQLKVIRWSNDSVLRQSPAGKNVSMEGEDTVEIRHQAITGEDTADCEDSACPIEICEV
jgi:hypothetical protein